MPGVTIKFTGQLDPGAWGYRAVLFNGSRRLGFTGLLYWYTPALHVILYMTTRCQPARSPKAASEGIDGDTWLVRTTSYLISVQF